MKEDAATLPNPEGVYLLFNKIHILWTVNIISIVWRNWIRLKLISSSYLPIDRMYFTTVCENTIQHDRADKA